MHLIRAPVPRTGAGPAPRLRRRSAVRSSWASSTSPPTRSPTAGSSLDADAAVAHGRQLLADGADWLDVGGESTRPGRRAGARGARSCAGCSPWSRRSRRAARAVSIDTRKPAVARAAVAAGATLLNDVGAANGDVAAELGVAWAAMHAQGEPATMQDDPRYDDVVAEVRDELVERAEAAPSRRRARGLDRPRHRLRQDPRAQPRPARPPRRPRRHRLPRARRHQPQGVPRAAPRFAPTAPTSRLPVDDRLEGSLATATWAMTCGAAHGARPRRARHRSRRPGHRRTSIDEGRRMREHRTCR